MCIHWHNLLPKLQREKKLSPFQRKTLAETIHYIPKVRQRKPLSWTFCSTLIYFHLFRNTKNRSSKKWPNICPRKISAAVRCFNTGVKLESSFPHWRWALPPSWRLQKEFSARILSTSCWNMFQLRSEKQKKRNLANCPFFAWPFSTNLMIIYGLLFILFAACNNQGAVEYADIPTWLIINILPSSSSPKPSQSRVQLPSWTGPGYHIPTECL